MNIMIPGHHDYSGPVPAKELVDESLKKLPCLVILSLQLGVGIGRVTRRTLNEITTYHDQVRPRNPLMVPSSGITDDRREELVVSDTGVRRSMQVRDMEHGGHETHLAGEYAVCRLQRARDRPIRQRRGRRRVGPAERSATPRYVTSSRHLVKHTERPRIEER